MAIATIDWEGMACHLYHEGFAFPPFLFITDKQSGWGSRRYVIIRLLCADCDCEVLVENISRE